MKIEYEMPDSVTEAGQMINQVREKIPPELLEIVTPLFKMTDHFYHRSMTQFFEIEKLKLMWQLRSLEKEIDNEGGILKLTKDGGLLLDGFSKELMKKIGEAVKKDVDFM